MKVCKACGIAKPHSDFARAPTNSDGHCSMCNPCRCEYVRARRAADPDRALKDKQHRDRYRSYYKSYISAYHKRPEVRQRVQETRQTPAYKTIKRARSKEWTQKYPDRYRAVYMVKAAIVAGKLTPLPCWVCDAERTQAHHPDYSAPLAVVWLCVKHHQQTHSMHREIQRDYARREQQASLQS